MEQQDARKVPPGYVLLKSSDGFEFYITEECAKVSKFLKTTLESKYLGGVNLCVYTLTKHTRWVLRGQDRTVGTQRNTWAFIGKSM
jgi:hypothetical protein